MIKVLPLLLSSLIGDFFALVDGIFFRVAFREGFLRFLAFPVSDWTSRGNA